MIARTETAYGLNEGIREGYGQLGYTKLQRIEDPEGDPEWDCTCRENNGAIYTLAESQGVLPEHPNCILGDTRIIAPGIKKGYSASYNGPIFQIMVKGGIVSTTGNHMFLTPNGFTRANALRKGDKIFYSRLFQREANRDPNNNGNPPFINQVIASLSKARGMTPRSMKISSKDFHGDGTFMDGNVDIINTDGLLLDDSQAAIPQKISKNLFAPGYSYLSYFARFGFLDSLFKTLAFSADSIMGGRNNPGSIGRRSNLLPHIISDFPAGSKDNPGSQKPPDNGLSAATEAFRNTVERFSSEITPLDIIDIKVIFHKDPLIVYDLETTSSLYITGGYFSSNCEGTWVAYSD